RSYDQGVSDFEAARAKAETKLAEGQAQLDQAAEELAEGEAQLGMTQADIDAAKAELAQGEQEWA
ncbi:MAG: hypothetical protein IJ092_11725, partial [Atopobiaceae bacterium]|nr:hypothetical protein [Atopobiaceae bacterium]